MSQPDERSLHLLVGELTATSRATSEAVRIQTAAIERLSREVQTSGNGFARLEEGLKRANADIITLRDSVVTPGTLRKFGLHTEDAAQTKLDLEHLRELRETSDSRRPIGDNVKQSVVVLVVVSILGWAGTALWKTVRIEITAPPPTDETRRQ